MLGSSIPEEVQSQHSPTKDCLTQHAGSNYCKIFTGHVTSSLPGVRCAAMKQWIQAVYEYAGFQSCKRCDLKSAVMAEYPDERVFVVRGEDEVCSRNLLLRCCIIRAINMPLHSSYFLEVIFNKGWKAERRMESKEFRADSPNVNFLMELRVNLHNLPSIEVCRALCSSSCLLVVELRDVVLYKSIYIYISDPVLFGFIVSSSHVLVCCTMP